MDFTLTDAAFGLGLAVLVWIVSVRGISKAAAASGVHLRQSPMGVVTSLCAVAVLGLDLWANRGMRGHMDQWLGRSVCISVMMAPWFWTLCGLWAIASSTQRQRHGGLLWRRANVEDPVEDASD
jgi:hypothetical protein